MRALKITKESENMNKRVSILTLCLILLMVLCSPVLGAAFVKFDGVDGESQDANHDKWSDVLSIAHGYSVEDAKAKKTGGPVVQPMVLSKELDKAGIKIAEALLTEHVFETVEIELTATYGGARATYLKYTLYGVRVVSYQVNASGNDEAGPPNEQVHLVFSGIDVTYTEYDDTGSSQGNVEYSYDVVK